METTPPQPPEITAARFLAALDVPVTEAVLAACEGVPVADLRRQADRLITAEVAAELWSRWNPGDASAQLPEGPFLRALVRVLADSFDIGRRLGRLQDAIAALAQSDPTDSRLPWIRAFEECAATEDFGVLRIHLGREQFQALHMSNRGGPDDPKSWDRRLDQMADDVFYDLGLILRRPVLLVDDALPSPWFRCEWNDLALPPLRGLSKHEVMVNDTPERLRLLGLEGSPATHPETGAPCAIIDARFAEKAESAGLTARDWADYAILCLGAGVRSSAGTFVNRAFYDLCALRLRDFSPDLIALLEQRYEPAFVVQVLRALLEEGIGIRNLSTVFQSILELREVIPADLSAFILFTPATGGVLPWPGAKSPADLTPRAYAEFVRVNLKRQISHKYTRGQSTLIVYLLDPEVEKRFRRPGGLEARELAAFHRAVREEVSSLPPTSQSPVILTTMEVRPAVRRSLFPEFPRLAVLSYQELSPEMNIQAIARISPDFAGVAGA